MYVWEAKLLVRRRACEGRLYDLREELWRVIEYRNRHSPSSPAWHEHDKFVKRTREKISRELDEIKFTQDLAYAGPVVGGEMYIKGENGYQGPTILDLYDREIEKHRNKAESVMDNEGKPSDHADVVEELGIANGVELARNILTEPYKFLNEEERKGYDLAESNAKLADEQQIARVGGQTAKRGPGRPRKNTNTEPKEKDLTPQKAVLLRFDKTTGKAERQ